MLMMAYVIKRPTAYEAEPRDTRKTSRQGRQGGSDDILGNVRSEVAWMPVEYGASCRVCLTYR
jgi:hypothetical protein